MITVYPIGTTIYEPEKCNNGYTLFCFPLEPEVLLIDMNGNIVKNWKVQEPSDSKGIICPRAKMLRNGSILVVAENRIREYRWEGAPVWEFEPHGPAHHDVERLDNGNTLVLCREDVPSEYKEKIEDPVRRSANHIHGDFVLEVTPDKRVVWEWHMYEHLDVNHHCRECPPADWTHTNTVQAPPENRHFDAGDNRFKPGNILLSPRNLGFIFIVDKTTKRIVWEYAGEYAGGFAGQHEPHMVEKGLPGEGNIIIFDNGAPPMRSVAHTGQSYAIEIDPVTKSLVWMHKDGENFYSAFRSNVQRLPNGNTLICESEGHRIFEVTRQGEPVWEYAMERHRIIGRAYRYPYNYCPQLAVLEKPKERKIVPPVYVGTKVLTP